jgi:hypothetical protein
MDWKHKQQVKEDKFKFVQPQCDLEVVQKQ